MITWPETCPCTCGALVRYGLSRTGHAARSCTCTSCVNRRAVKKGKSAHAKMHRALGGIGFTPGNEESARVYSIDVLPESKKGYSRQVVKFKQFVATEFFRRALNQSARAIPAGTNAKPAVAIDGRWLIVDLA